MRFVNEFAKLRFYMLTELNLYLCLPLKKEWIFYSFLGLIPFYSVVLNLFLETQSNKDTLSPK